MTAPTKDATGVAVSDAELDRLEAIYDAAWSGAGFDHPLTHREALRVAVQADRTMRAAADSALLDALEARVRDADVWEDLALMWDHEDGFWLACAERGTSRGWHALDKVDAPPALTLRAALRAALADANAGGAR